MSNVKLFGRFLGFALELVFIASLIAAFVALVWWIAG